MTTFLNIFLENHKIIQKEMNKLYLHKMKLNKYSKNECFIQFKSATGGKESEDLAFVLFKNYLKIFSENNIDHEIIEIENNGQGFLKNAIIKVSFEYAYGFFKEEKGMHRFTRVSPYGNGKLHTSFVFVDVYPSIDFDNDLNIKKNDIRIDTFRGSGAGGQHKNVTDSAVRLTHVPTGIVVKIENERSQHQNKKIAYDILGAKILDFEKEKLEDEININKGKEVKQDWGSQIRSYSIEQNRVKDHRCNIEYNGTLDSYFNNLYEYIFKINTSILFEYKIL